MRNTRNWIAVAIAVAAVAFLYFSSRGIDRDTYSRGVSTILELQRRQDDLERELSTVRTESADAKERVGSALEKLEGVSTRLDSHVAAADNIELEAVVGKYKGALVDAGTLVRSAVENASVLGEGASRIMADLAVLETSSGLRSRSRLAMNELLKQVMLFDLSGKGDHGRGLSDAVNRVRAAASEEKDEDVRTQLENLARHTQVYVDDRILLEGRLEQVRALEMPRRLSDMLLVHESEFESQQRGAEYFRMGLYVFTAALLARLFQNMREIKRRTSELHEANQTLEQRVKDRTRRLSATNTALQIEVVERERAELQVREALAEVEKASRTKSEFLANMSHEIRTPMTSILGFSERLLDSGLSDTDKIEAVSTIRRNGDYLLQIINDILDISKIEAGMFSVEKIPCSPKVILAEVHAAMEVRAAIEGIELVVESDGAVPRSIVSDPIRLKQILLNLVGNAIKFTEEGSVRVTVGLDDTASQRLKFQVHDSGIGMDAETVTRLFRPFMQADSSTTRRFGGTGLGLSISKHLVELLGGEVSVESTPGKGSIFTFTVATGPLDDVELESGPNLSFLADLSDSEYLKPPPSLPGLRVLLAEDGEDNRRLLSYVLSSAQVTTTLASDGREAIDKVLASLRTGQPFDVILMDMQMPEVDGYEATKRLRAQGVLTPIIALTANATAADREKCLRAGCDDFCTKPIQRNTFLNVVAQWAERKKSRWAAPPLPAMVEEAMGAWSPGTTREHGATQKLDATAVREVGSSLRMSVPGPQSTTSGSRTASGSPSGEAEMPRTTLPTTYIDRNSGLRTLRMGTSRSASGSPSGSSASSTNLPDLTRLPPIQAFDPRASVAGSPSNSSAPGASNASSNAHGPRGPLPANESERGDGGAVVPPRAPAAAAGGSPAMDPELLELVNEFVAGLAEEVEQMRAALAAEDLVRLGILAHRLKGAAGSYGFPGLTALAATLEKQAKASAPTADMESQLERIAAATSAARVERGL